MPSPSQNHYEVLQIGRNATPDEIKRAWARLVRLHSPDRDPEGNRRINEARTTLLDAEARQDYDALLDFGEEITELLTTAQEAEEATNWDKAIACYREILAFHPTNYAARNRLALCQSYNGRNDLAAKTLQTLFAKNDRVAVYWSNYGQILDELAEETDDEGLRQQAVSAFERASELEPYNSGPLILLSQHWRRRKEFDLAEKCIDRAVNADGKADIDDLEALFELPLIHLFARRLHMLESDARRIRELIPEGNEEALGYAAFRFLSTANELCQNDLYREALEFVNASQTLRSVPDELKDWVAVVQRNASIQKEAVEIQADSSLKNPVSALGLFTVAEYFHEMTQDEEEEALEQLVNLIDQMPSRDVIRSVELLQLNYPNIFNINPSLFNEIVKLGRPAPSYLAPQAAGSNATGPTGCLLPISLLCFLLIAFIVCIDVL